MLAAPDYNAGRAARAANDFTSTTASGFPLFLLISAEERFAAWERNPPKAMPKFADTRKSPEQLAAEEAVLEAQREEAKAKRLKKELLLTGKPAVDDALAVPADLSGMVYDQRRMRFVPDKFAHMHRSGGAKGETVVAAVKGEDKARVKAKPASPAPAARKVIGHARTAPFTSKVGQPPTDKQAALLTMLARPEGATLAEIAAATGWEEHTAGARISGVKKVKTVNKTKEARGTVYRSET